MSTLSKRLSTTGAVLVVLAIPLVLYMQRWNIYDYTRLRGYTAPKAVEQLATDTAMNDKARRLFYVYHPDLQNKEMFNASCSSSEKTIVLGCYVNGRGIYLYNITEARLTGVIQVTAAHETLHAAYSRLSASDKSRIDKLLNDTFATVTDDRIKKTIDDYRKNGADVNNELHSILGTEVRNLSPELETYYRRYFTDRAKVVSLSESYESEFTSRKKQVEAYDQQLQDLKQEIDNGESGLGTTGSELKAQRDQLDQQLEAKQYEQYNQGVPGYNSKVNAYNALVRRVRALIDQYNDIVAKRNAIAAEEGELIKAIDSRPSTIDQ